MTKKLQFYGFSTIAFTLQKMGDARESLIHEILNWNASI